MHQATTAASACSSIFTAAPGAQCGGRGWAMDIPIIEVDEGLVIDVERSEGRAKPPRNGRKRAHARWMVARFATCAFELAVADAGSSFSEAVDLDGKVTHHRDPHHPLVERHVRSVSNIHVPNSEERAIEATTAAAASAAVLPCAGSAVCA
ncbi:hypothetical protein B0H14DRAFT_2638547 [Mycena olivaceomarginata]|nr:hypothetical protein B0H14DRAFT_2638547 [Mycena olivaceomarginata]